MAYQYSSIELLFTALCGILILKLYGPVLRLWRARSSMRALRNAGMPMPPHSLAFGHLLAAKYARDELPSDAHSMYILNRLSAKYGEKGLVYVDTSPIYPHSLLITDPYVANQAIQHPIVGSEKASILYGWFYPITGGHSLFTQNGEDWKRDHNIFLPFFNNANLDAAIPTVVDQLVIYRDKLREKSELGERFTLEPLTLSMMNDIIGKLIFNADLNMQQNGSHPLADGMVRQLQLKFGANDVLAQLGSFSPVNKFNIWRNGHKLNNQIRLQIEKRFAVHQSAKAQDERQPFMSVLDIALQDYLSENNRQDQHHVDSAFVTSLCAQLRMFFFAGYDSTAAAMVYCCYTIWKHPNVLAKIRAEHDKVFGTNIASALDIIAGNPIILNSLPYTNAVIKETMRLFPPANGIRQGSSELVLEDREGNKYPTEGCSVQFNHMSIQRNPRIWKQPNDFIPERFLVEQGHELYPEKGAWRPFEYGTRLCTGQALVIKEVKAFLVMLVREFDVLEAYDEVDGDRGNIDLSGVYGEKVYQVEAGAAHPRNHYPCRISLSNYHAANKV